MSDPDQADFFISYTAADRPWAEWIAWQLEASGCSVVLQAWDFRPGRDFVHEMQAALERATRTIVVLSNAYLRSELGEAEWRAVFASDPAGERAALVPVRVDDVDPPGLLRTRILIDIAGKSRDDAQRLLLSGLRGERAKPTVEPLFPGAEPRGGEPQFPGAGPRLTNLPARNPNFTGREAMLDELHAALDRDPTAAVVHTEAIHGLGGVGKTEFALEYAHRYADAYDIVWWIRAEVPTTAGADVVELGAQLGVREEGDQTRAIELTFFELRRRARWLLIYDNAERPETLEELLPRGGGGHVLITSRWSAWRRLAQPFALGTLPRDEAVQFLEKRTGIDDAEALGRVAELLGDLPLALEEAGAYLEETGSGPAEYCVLVQKRWRQLFGEEQPGEAGDLAERRVATVWSVTLDQIRAEAPLAGELLTILAYLAPDGIPRDLPQRVARALPGEAGETFADPLAYGRMVGALHRYSLVDATADAISIHRLVQTVIRSQRDPEEEADWALAVALELFDRLPTSDRPPWDEIEATSRLLPHVLAVTGHLERLDVHSSLVLALLSHSASIIAWRGDTKAATELVTSALALARRRDKSDGADIFELETQLGVLMRAVGDFEEAQRLHKAALDRVRELDGASGARTITATQTLARTLRDAGELAAARELQEEVVAARVAALGEDHDDVLDAKRTLGSILLGLADPRALELSQDVVDARTKTLGEDHLDTLLAKSDLGEVLRTAGALDAARALQEEVVERLRERLGAEHRETLAALNNLALTLTYLGDTRGAVDLHRQLYEILASRAGDDDPTTLSSLHNLAGAKLEAGDVDDARDLFERVWNRRKETFGAHHPHTLLTLEALAACHEKRGDRETAASLYEQALTGFAETYGSGHALTLSTARTLGELRAPEDA